MNFLGWVAVTIGTIVAGFIGLLIAMDLGSNRVARCNSIKAYCEAGRYTETLDHHGIRTCKCVWGEDARPHRIEVGSP